MADPLKAFEGIVECAGIFEGVADEQSEAVRVVRRELLETPTLRERLAAAEQEIERINAERSVVHEALTDIVNNAYAHPPRCETFADVAIQAVHALQHAQKVADIFDRRVQTTIAERDEARRKALKEAAERCESYADSLYSGECRIAVRGAAKRVLALTEPAGAG